MKKTLVIFVLALVSIGLSAQDGLKGIWFAGGQVQFSSSKGYEGNVKMKTTSTTVLPIVGGFVSPSVAIGAGVGYMGGKTKIDGNQESKNQTIIIKPLARKYWNITGGLYFFAQAALPISFGKTEGTNSDSKINTTGVSLELAPGFDFVINSWITIETSFTILNTGYLRAKPKDGKADSGFGFNANPFNSVDDRKVGDLQVGIKFLF